MAALLVACSPPNDCIARGASSEYSGTVTYTGQTAGDAGVTSSLTGSIPFSITVYDATASCTYDGMEFTIAVGGCTLWAELTASDAGDATTASIEPGQSCDLALAQGSLAMSIASGSLAFGGDGTMLVLAGNVGGGTGYLDWSFMGG